MRSKLPDFSEEKQLWEKGYLTVGIDEVGRGAFAGPLYVAGALFPKDLEIKKLKELEKLGINDSKLLTVKKREELSEIIKQEVMDYSIVSVPVEVINTYGIGQATQIGMRKVVKNLNSRITHEKLYVLTDAFEIKRNKDLNILGQKGIIRGDQISISIAAASIIAKVARDLHMSELSDNYPLYFFEKNKGYGTVSHRSAIVSNGPCILHRTDFISKTIHISERIRLTKGTKSNHTKQNP